MVNKVLTQTQSEDPRPLKAKKRWRKKTQNDHEIKFDPKARNSYITGFHKRKEERKKKARTEEMEAERKDKLDTKRELREEVKKRWKDVLWAERTVDRVLAKRKVMMKDREERLMLANGGVLPKLNKMGVLAITDGAEAGSDDESEGGESFDSFDVGERNYNPAALEDGDDDDDGRLGGKIVKVGFEKVEDDDPFGDCEVTTSAIQVRNENGESSSASTRTMRASTALALLRKEQEETRIAMQGGNKHLTPEELEAHRKLRAMNIHKEERRRLKSLDKRMKRDLVLKKFMKKKQKKKAKPKGNKKVKAGAKTRRGRKS